MTPPTQRERHPAAGTQRRTPEQTVRVLHVLPSLFKGGMERAMVRLICGSAEAAAGGKVTDGIVHGLCVLRDADPDLLAQCRSCATTWVLGRGHGGGESRNLWSWLRLRQVVRCFRPDVVHARSTSIWLDAALATLGHRQVRLLLSFHGRTRLSPVGRWRRRLHRWTAARADAVLAVSQDAACMIHDEWGVPERTLCSIPNGVDVRRFCPAKDDEETCQTRIQLNLSRTDHVVVCVANLYAIKGLDVLVRAWRQVSMVDPSARLVVAGLGPLRTELEQQTNELRCGSTVRFLGFTENVSALLRCADLFVLPSRYEACSNGVLEAMATGLPVVASDVGGMRELITPNRTGWLVPSDSPDRLAETILAALLDQPARQRIGQAARSAVVEQFTLKTCVGRYASLYRELSGRDHAQPDAAMETLACAG